MTLTNNFNNLIFNDMEKRFTTFHAFCKANNLRKGTVKHMEDNFTFCECKEIGTGKNVRIYFDVDDNCVYFL